MSSGSLWWIEFNIANNRTTLIRADRIVELRDDYRTEGKGRIAEKIPICRVILEGGANLVAEGETMSQIWNRMQEALQRPFHMVRAPDIEEQAEQDAVD